MTLTDFNAWYHSRYPRYHRTSSGLTAVAFIVSDLIAIMLSLGAGFFLVNLYDMSLINFRSFVTYWPYLPVFILIFQLCGLYPGVSLAPADEFRNFFVASLMGFGGIILSRYIEDEEFGALSVAFGLGFVFSTFILLICRNGMHVILRKTGLGGIPAVLYGSGSTARLVVDQLLDSMKTGYTPVLILDNEAEFDWYREVPVIHDIALGPEIVKQYNIKMAIVAMPELDEHSLTRLLNYSVSAFRYNVLIPDFFKATNIWMDIRDFNGILGFVTSHRLKMLWNLAAKRFMDVSVTIVGGLVLMPLFVLIALIIKLTSPGPVLYGHRRLGKNGVHFRAFKFRSMAVDAEARLNKLLRRTSFDEFPQLLNILKGEMSLVGPRPVVDEEVSKYGEDFKRIFSVKPGLTGLWQVSGRSDTDYNERVSFDTYYLQSWSVWLDMWIMYKTVAAVIRGKGAY
jgi:exopolysaccharide biosynthesis polyprenyl glycosylphosphotransferase